MVQEKLVSSDKTNKDEGVHQEEKKTILLKDIASIESSKVSVDEVDIQNYISTENMIPNLGGVFESESKPLKGNITSFKKNDILISNIRPYLKKIWYSDKDGGCSSDVLVLRALNNKIDKKYLFYILSSDKFFNYVMSTSKGTKMPRGDKNAILKFKVPIKNIENQKLYSNFLTVIDKKIELLEKKLVLYQELDLSLKNQIFNSFKNSSFIKLNDLCQIKKGKQLNKSDMENKGEYYVLNGGKEPSGHTNSWNVEENTITISEGGNSCGFVSFNTEKFYCGGHCYYLTLKQENFDLKYLYHYLKYIEPNIMRLRVGSGLPNIQKGDIENINILKLDFNQQKEVGNFLDLINEKIILNLKEKEELENFKKGLLQKMFI